MLTRLQLLLLFAGSTVFADTIFTDSATLYPFSSSDFTFDYSQLVVLDTPEGFEVTGVFNATYTGGGGFSGGVFFGTVVRTLGVTSASTRAHLSATVSTTGNLVATALNQGTAIWRSPFFTCSVASSNIYGTPGLNGFYEGPTTEGQICGGDPLYNADLIPGVATLQQGLSFGVNVPAGGGGSLTFDFGNSSLSEAPVPGQIPEPSTGWLFGLGVGLVAIRNLRRYRVSASAACDASASDRSLAKRR